MARVLNLYEAKTHLSALVDEVAAGGEIVIAKAGEPRAKLVPIRPAVQRTPGRVAGRIWIADDFDSPLPDDVRRGFEG
jgi:prevent-host-death family protein